MKIDIFDYINEIIVFGKDIMKYNNFIFNVVYEGINLVRYWYYKLYINNF